MNFELVATCNFFLHEKVSYRSGTDMFDKWMRREYREDLTTQISEEKIMIFI